MNAEFDLVLPGAKDPEPFAARAAALGLSALGLLFRPEDDVNLNRLSRLSEQYSTALVPFLPDGGEETRGTFLHLQYYREKGGLWDLADSESFAALLQCAYHNDAGEFLTAFLRVVETDFAAHRPDLVIGLEAFRLHVDPASPFYRRTMVRLAKLFAKGKTAIGYGAASPIYGLSSATLRSFAEEGGSLVPASFATSPDAILAGWQDSLLGARACGFGSIAVRRAETNEWEPARIR